MKNLAKSFFISVLPVLALVYFVKAILNFSVDFSFLGIILISIPIILFFSLLFIKPVARTSKNLIVYTLPIILGTAISFFSLDINIISSALILALGWFLYITWYSKLENRENSIIQVGKKLPLLTFENDKKEQIEISNIKSDFKILLFYRGNWCPLCMAQIKEIADAYKELAQKNAEVFLISSQPHEFTSSLAKKHKVPFHFLVDVNNKNAKILDLVHENGLPMGFQLLGYDSDVVLPTVIITDKDNSVIFADLTDNYRVRPEPATFLEIINKHSS
ncbi:redoxin domain-containing protein [uncultured Tenacibaculum sp.]|uniref:redoxin domain-containing protein n=1 Tax=uncultured Tenacibaculum sp. TaxID=174713 RepID=UPI0026204359|nr:redoxin domain-containing protein [uncultured Tenacibaculum sp.]